MIVITLSSLLQIKTPLNLAIGIFKSINFAICWHQLLDFQIVMVELEFQTVNISVPRFLFDTDVWISARRICFRSKATPNVFMWNYIVKLARVTVQVESSQRIIRSNKIK